MSKIINEVKEHDGCVDCKYINIKINNRPCKSCTSNYEQPNRYPDLWEDIEEPKQEIPGPIRPSHYKSCSIECIDAMILTFGTDAVALFCQINAFKYIWRHKDKNGLIDLEKASWYIDKAVELGEYNIGIDDYRKMIEKSVEEYNGKEN